MKGQTIQDFNEARDNEVADASNPVYVYTYREFRQRRENKPRCMAVAATLLARIVGVKRTATTPSATVHQQQQQQQR